MEKIVPFDVYYEVLPYIEDKNVIFHLYISEVLKNFLKNFIYDVSVLYYNNIFKIQVIGDYTYIPNNICLTIDNIIYLFYY